HNSVYVPVLLQRYFYRRTNNRLLRSLYFLPWVSLAAKSTQKIPKFADHFKRNVYMSIAKTYNPADAEEKWYAYWLEKKFFRSVPDEREPYTIVMPPPNV